MRNKEKERNPVIVINLTRTDVITIRSFHCTTSKLTDVYQQRGINVLLKSHYFSQEHSSVMHFVSYKQNFNRTVV